MWQINKILFFLILGCSCSLINKNQASKSIATLGGYQKTQRNDYIDHFQKFEKFYLNSKTTKEFRLRKKDYIYLKSIVHKIISSNELFFDQESKATFHIIQNESPFHFSLPGRKIFISTGLIKKYIKNESLLYCLLSYELIRSERNIYHKKLIIPTGTIGTTKMMSLMRLKTSEKVDMHKWTFYILNRVGIDTDIYLSWIQIQNRNSVDFSLQLGDINSISREESLFKSFIIENTKVGSKVERYRGSSSDFYSFVNRIR